MTALRRTIISLLDIEPDTLDDAERTAYIDACRAAMRWALSGNQVEHINRGIREPGKQSAARSLTTAGAMRAVEAHGWNIEAAAIATGVCRPTMTRRLKAAPDTWRQQLKQAISNRRSAHARANAERINQSQSRDLEDAHDLMRAGNE